MIFIGIAGPSGAGKTTLAQFLKTNLKDKFEHIRQDDYLKHPDEFPMLGKYKNWEHPNNYSFRLLYDHLRRLSSGQKVITSTFATRAEDRHQIVLEPKPYVLVDGSLILTSEDLASMFDKKIYLEIPSELMIVRRRERSNHFGVDTEDYDREVTIPEFEKHGALQKIVADHIIDGTQSKEVVVEQARKIME